VTHPDRLVPKAELLDAVWGQTAVTEAVVRVAVGTLRKVLGDTAQAPRYIVTMPRRGYRFVAPVVEGPAAALPAPTTIPPPSDALPALARPDARHPTETHLLPTAERRYLTVLWCALVEVTGLGGYLDPEDWREVVRAYHQTCAAVIERFDGYVDHAVGDAVVACFGYPVAHEDDAQRAVRAGLVILEALDGPRSQYRPSLMACCADGESPRTPRVGASRLARRARHPLARSAPD
jgi:Transcriptional regulatory protein, C terminal